MNNIVHTLLQSRIAYKVYCDATLLWTCFVFVGVFAEQIMAGIFSSIIDITVALLLLIVAYAGAIAWSRRANVFYPYQPRIAWLHIVLALCSAPVLLLATLSFGPLMMLALTALSMVLIRLLQRGLA